MTRIPFLPEGFGVKEAADRSSAPLTLDPHHTADLSTSARLDVFSGNALGRRPA